jgi:hypothetical protein
MRRVQKIDSALRGEEKDKLLCLTRGGKTKINSALRGGKLLCLTRRVQKINSALRGEEKDKLLHLTRGEER